MDLDRLAHHIAEHPARGRRKLVAVAGPPASGKSTLAEKLSDLLPGSGVVPMDGFHLDNERLRELDMLDRKGSPATFDARGFADLVARLATDAQVSYPIFDRALDKAIPNAASVQAATHTVIVEGNYLLLDQPIWRDLAALWDVSVQLSVPLPTLQARLMQRWADLGHSVEDAARKTEHNDLPNARLVLENALPADIVVSDSEA